MVAPSGMFARQWVDGMLAFDGFGFSCIITKDARDSVPFSGQQRLRAYGPVTCFFGCSVPEPYTPVTGGLRQAIVVYFFFLAAIFLAN